VTVSNNSGLSGGGIYNDGNFDLRFITVSGNNSEGIRIDGGAEIKIRSSALANNSGGNCAGIAPDSLDYNIENDGSCALAGPNDLPGSDPILEPLAPHGGMAPSHALGPGSPAIDSGVPDLCIAIDQNGTSRPQGALCDRGAHENMSLRGSISGWTYIDANRNNIFDPDDGFMTGVFVEINEGVCPPSGTLVETVESDSSGYYEILNIPAGNYCLETSPLQGTLYPDHIEVPLDPGQIEENINFRYMLSALGDSSVSGLVWHDLCAVPYSPSSVPPPGCIALAGGGLGADGVYDPTEPGIAGVELVLFSGACPPPPVAPAGVVLTDLDGEYSLPELTAGTWCLVVDALDPPNDTILIPGNWTYPDRDAQPALAEFVLGSSEDLTGIDFGWDYQFLPEPPPVPEGFRGVLNKNAFCREGPGTVYGTTTAYERGTEFEVLARSEPHLSLWFYIEELALRINCWISAAVADYDFDPELLPTRIAPPTPTPTPTPEPETCDASLGPEDCKKLGGQYKDDTCICP
jgi:hypothetical protein